MFLFIYLSNNITFGMLNINDFLDNLESYQEVGSKALNIEHNLTIGGISMMQAVLGVATLGIGILISVVVYKIYKVGVSRFLGVQFHFDGIAGSNTRDYPFDLVQFNNDPIQCGINFWSNPLKFLYPKSVNHWIGRFDRIDGSFSSPGN